VIATEAISEIITSSKLTDPLRKRWKSWTYQADGPPPETCLQAFKVWFDTLISCGYCTSVWVAGSFALFMPEVIIGDVINWFAWTFAIHRASNWLHVTYELVRKGRIASHDVTLSVGEHVVDGTTIEEAANGDAR